VTSAHQAEDVGLPGSWDKFVVHLVGEAAPAYSAPHASSGSAWLVEDQSLTARPWNWVTRGKAIGGRPPAVSQVDEDAMGNGIAPHVGQVLTKQISRSTGISGGCRSDYFHMMAFPIHLSTDGNFDSAS
jgi:hypothetical protein